MASAEEYRCADYDMDPDFDTTTSWPDGLHEMQRFEPYLIRPIRRISTNEDIQRYKNHFCIAQRNQGLTWRQYLKILQAKLRQFDTRDLVAKAIKRHLTSSWNAKKLHDATSKLELYKKPESRFKISEKDTFINMKTVEEVDSMSSLEYTDANGSFEKLPGRLASSRESGFSHYVTASESGFSLPTYKVTKAPPLAKTECVGDTDSVSSVTCISMNSISPAADSSMNSNGSFSPQKNLLKKFCSGIRGFAVKTKKTVKKVYVKPNYCSACGSYVGDIKTNEECSQSVLNPIDFRKPFTPGMLKSNNNLSRSISKTSMTSIGSGDCSVKPQLTEKVTSTYKKKMFTKRMLPFIK